MCSFSTPLCAARRSGLLARYSSDCCFGETLPRDAFLHLIAHWWPIHNARRAPASQLFRLCQVGQYLEPGAICVRRTQWRGVEAARPRRSGGDGCRRDEATCEATSENPDQNQDAARHLSFVRCILNGSSHSCLYLIFGYFWFKL